MPNGWWVFLFLFLPFLGCFLYTHAFNGHYREETFGSYHSTDLFQTDENGATAHLRCPGYLKRGDLKVAVEEKKVFNTKTKKLRCCLLCRKVVFSEGVQNIATGHLRQ
jgi:hypothetical protein